MAGQQQPQGFVPDGFQPDKPTGVLGNLRDFAQYATQQAWEAGSEIVGGTLMGAWDTARALMPNPVAAYDAASRGDVAGMAREATRATPSGAIAMFGADQLRAAIPEAQKGLSAIDAGDYGTAMRQLIKIVPLFGGQADHLIDNAKEGQWGRVAGGLVNLLAPFAGKALPKRVSVPGFMRNKNPEAARAMDAALDAGVPIDLGTASGSKMTKRLQFAGEAGTFAGFKDFETPVAEGFQRMGRGVADATRPGPPATPETAGTKVGTGVRATMNQQAAAQRQAYGQLDQIAAQHVESVPVTRMVKGPDGKFAPQTVMVDMEAPVDIRPLRAQLQDTWDFMRQAASNTDWVKQNNPGYNALRNLMNTKDGFVPLKVFREWASAVSERGVGTEVAGLRNKGQGNAANVAGVMKSAIEDRLNNLGADSADALQAWNDGRAATKQKYATGKVAQRVGYGDEAVAEPVKTFERFVAPRDTNINLLRQAVSRAPGSGVEIGRAWFDRALQRVMTRGEVDHTKAVLNEWDNLGSKTKEILFPDPQVRQQVGDFLYAVKAWNDSPNPSGTGAIAAGMRFAESTGRMLGAYGVPAGSGAGMAYRYGGPEGLLYYAAGQGAGSLLTLMAHNPSFVKALTQGFEMPVRGPVRGAAVAGLAGQTPTPGPETPRMSAGQDARPNLAKQAGPGIHTLSDGSVWRVERDGTTVTQVQ